MTFGENVFNRRRELGLSQQDLAEALGVAPATVCKIEHDLIEPKSKTAKKITEFLKLDEPIDVKCLTGNRIIDLSMLERRVSNAIFELELILDIIQSMKGESNEESI